MIQYCMMSYALIRTHLRKISLPVFLLLSVWLSACSSDNDAKAEGRERIVFDGIGDQGIFDPSLARDSGSSRIWMSYSEVDNSSWPGGSDPAYNHLIHTRMAFSDDAGATWSDAGILVNTSEDVVIPIDDGTGTMVDHDGTWVHEVSALVFDPDDPDPDTRWKLFWHHYLWLDGLRLFQHGWIAMKTAPSPTGPWSAERKLFVGSIYDTASDAMIGSPEVHLDLTHGDLGSCLAFSEPGALAAGGALYLALLGAEGSSQNGRIILLRSADHGLTWTYRGTLLLNSADGPGLGCHGFSAPALFERGGRYFLIATPQVNDWYSGTSVFEISDLDTASLVRDGGIPRVITRVDGTAGSFNGAAGYIPEATGSGVIYSEAFLSETPRFRIFKSRIRL